MHIAMGLYWTAICLAADVCLLFALQAYQYTSITSATLLDCFTIPAVLFLSFLVLRYLGSETQGSENWQ
jgi:solute carrier family 35 protein F1/2